MSRPSAIRICLPFDPAVHALPQIDRAALCRRVMGIESQRRLVFARFEDEMVLREQRLSVTRDWLGGRLKDLLRLRRAWGLADAAGRDSTERLQHAITREHEALRRAAAVRHRAFETDWMRTLRPLPDWLSEWAATAGHDDPHRERYVAIERRHHTLCVGYAWADRRFRVIRENPLTRARRSGLRLPRCLEPEGGPDGV